MSLSNNHKPTAFYNQPNCLAANSYEAFEMFSTADKAYFLYCSLISCTVYCWMSEILIAQWVVVHKVVLRKVRKTFVLYELLFCGLGWHQNISAQHNEIHFIFPHMASICHCRVISSCSVFLISLYMCMYN